LKQKERHFLLMLLLLTGRYAKLVLVENAALGRLQVKTKKNKKIKKNQPA